ncbi:hypothetical protein CYPRO_1737 [Cyclonatronum proteinivorum]|uniref:Uncharacterized protein n=1 Tax=Cyclonatronum proteinivorum TaxID=1457365 RepID=A0A345UKI5_9BACT|nr:hypothetical protein CYPRO_1737 [Cyclonatronum proteinivorum]
MPPLQGSTCVVGSLPGVGTPGCGMSPFQDFGQIVEIIICTNLIYAVFICGLRVPIQSFGLSHSARSLRSPGRPSCRRAFWRFRVKWSKDDSTQEKCL